MRVGDVDAAVHDVEFVDDVDDKSRWCSWYIDDVDAVWWDVCDIWGNEMYVRMVWVGDIM